MEITAWLELILRLKRRIQQVEAIESIDIEF
jgi:hypothetical protein